MEQEQQARSPDRRLYVYSMAVALGCVAGIMVAPLGIGYDVYLGWRGAIVMLFAAIAGAYGGIVVTFVASEAYRAWMRYPQVTRTLVGNGVLMASAVIAVAVLVTAVLAVPSFIGSWVPQHRGWAVVLFIGTSLYSGSVIGTTLLPFVFAVHGGRARREWRALTGHEFHSDVVDIDLARLAVAMLDIDDLGDARRARERFVRAYHLARKLGVTPKYTTVHAYQRAWDERRIAS